jgi:hypothetical protein
MEMSRPPLTNAASAAAEPVVEPEFQVGVLIHQDPLILGANGDAGGQSHAGVLS